MEEMENENKELRDQMKEHQERVDKIPGAPKLLPKRDVGRFVEQPYSEEAAPHSIPKTFKMPPYLRIYDGTTDPEDYLIHNVTALKGNDLSKEPVPSVLLKKFGETLTGGRGGANMVLTAASQNNISSHNALNTDAGTDPVRNAHREARAGGQETRGMEEGGYQSKIRVQDDQLGTPSGSVHPNRFATKPPRDTDRGSRFNKERYRPYIEDRRNVSRRNAPRNDRRVDRGQSSRGLIGKTGSDRRSGPVEAPRLSEYNFSVDASSIVSAISKIKDTRWPKPIQTDPYQRNPNLMCKYHGTHGHKTEDYRQLREEVAQLFNEGAPS
ncbi:PREDICTED: uncharacterized protein LOC109207483 [Nicotiana attenuata]|uniref:uncharacterized protein LOC109207483 n=1 Tax=Nicotiana attenuata TaxID=49451 RepID=UPI000904926E|nr:PREDICTED: uncharacterized protein LOC109207483 [Nicotiana attenuata]